MKAYLRLHFLVLLWGFTGVIGKLITISALPLVFYRILFAFLGVGLFILLTKVPLRDSFTNILKLLGAGSIIGLHWVLFFWAIKESNVSVALSTLSTGALFTAFLEPLFFRRRINLGEIVPSVLVIACLYFIFKTSPHYTAGIAIGVACSFLSALFSVVNAKIYKTFRPSKMIFYELIGGWLIVTIVLWLNGDIHEVVNVSHQDIRWLLLLSLVLTAFPMIESTKLLKYINPFSMLLAINLEPVYGMILAYFIFGESEQMSIKFYIAAGVMLGVIVGYELLKTYKKEKKESAFMGNKTDSSLDINQ